MAATKAVAKKKSGFALKAGLGIAAAAAAAGAYYFLASPEAKKHRKDAKVWANKAKQDLVAQMKKMKTVSEKSYSAAASQVIAKYKKFEKEHPKEFAAVSKELKGQWSKIKKHLPKK